METTFMSDLDSVPSINANWLALSLWSRIFTQHTQPKLLSYKGKLSFGSANWFSMLIIVTQNRNDFSHHAPLFPSPLLIISGNYDNHYSKTKKINETRAKVNFQLHGDYGKAFLETIKQRVWSVQKYAYFPPGEEIKNMSLNVSTW